MREFLIGSILALLPVMSPRAYAGEIPKEISAKLDALISGAYQTAAAKFPCKVKSAGKFHMIKWQEVDRCLNGAADSVDWDGLTRQIEALKAGTERISAAEFATALESSLSAHALKFEQVFSTKDERALLPLTNSLLHFMPADSLRDLPVTDRAGTHVGAFSGVYVYERTGGLSTANTFKLTLFQYTDQNGNVQSSTDKLLLDSFGVPFSQASPQPGFRLPADKLNLKP